MESVALVPALNEEETIAKIVKRLKKIKIKPIVIDDGSSDDTARLAKKAGAIVIVHKANKGKGEALKTGFRYVLKKCPKTKYVVLIDADMQYAPEDSLKLIKPLKDGEADFVTGYRNWRTVPYRHQMGNFVWRTAFNLLFGTQLNDTNCGFMAFTKKAISKIKEVHGGYIIENMLFLEALKHKIKIKQVNVDVRYDELRNIPVGIRIVLGCLVFIIVRGVKYRLKNI